MELITYREEDDRYSGIEWKMLGQNLTHIEGKPHDVLKYQVTGFKDADWKSLKEEWEGPDGINNPDFDKVKYFERRNHLKQSFGMEFWFEISSFYGQFF